MTTFHCPHCNKAFENVSAKNGHQAHCLKRVHGVDRIKIDHNGEKKKYCPVCHQYKSLPAFRKDSHKEDGLAYRCRVCALAAERTYNKAGKKTDLAPVKKTINPQFGMTIPEVIKQEPDNIIRTDHIKWDHYQPIIDEFESLGYQLEKKQEPDNTAYDTVSDTQGLIVLCSDTTMRFWITKAKGQLSNHDALKKLLLEA